jgi:hypothetical protein
MTFCAGFLVLTMAVVWAASTETSATTEAAELVASSLKDVRSSQAAELDRVLTGHDYANSLRIVGKIDAIRNKDREFSISGWAADLDDVFARPIVLAIYKGQVLVATTPTLFRSDVLARLGLTHPWGPAAFVSHLAPGRCSPDLPITFVAVNFSRKKYRAIDTRNCPTE